MTPVEATRALNENSVNAVRRLAEHLGVDPVGLSERLDLVALVERLDGLLVFEAESAKFAGLTECTCVNHSRESDRAYESGICPHQCARDLRASLRGDQTDEAALRRLMDDPRYWRDADPEIIRQVEDGFKRLYPDK